MLHIHDTHEFFFCKDGSGEQHTEKGHVRMKKGDFFFFPEGQLHIGNGSGEGGCTGMVLNVKDSSLLRLAEDEPEIMQMLNSLKDCAWKGKNRIALSRAGIDMVREIFESMTEEKRTSRRGVASALKIRMEQLLLILLRESKIPISPMKAMEKQPLSDRKISEICRFLENNYMSHLAIEQMAKMSGLSRSHFHALFRKNTGKTFTKYLNSIRCKEALRLLRETDLDTVDISRICGFESLSHFYCVFRKETGKKPSSFRSPVMLSSR